MEKMTHPLWKIENMTHFLWKMENMTPWGLPGNHRTYMCWPPGCIKPLKCDSLPGCTMTLEPERPNGEIFISRVNLPSGFSFKIALPTLRKRNSESPHDIRTRDGNPRGHLQWIAKWRNPKSRNYNWHHQLSISSCIAFYNCQMEKRSYPEFAYFLWGNMIVTLESGVDSFGDVHWAGIRLLWL